MADRDLSNVYTSTLEAVINSKVYLVVYPALYLGLLLANI